MIRELQATNFAVRIHVHVQVCDPGVTRKCFDRAIVNERRLAEPRGVLLVEGGKDHSSVRALKRSGKRRIVLGVGGCAEIDVEGDLRGAERTQVVDELTMNAPRPRPAALRKNALLVDVDENDIAGRCALGQEEAKVGESVIERTKPSGERRCQDRRGNREYCGGRAKHGLTPLAAQPAPSRCRRQP